MQRYYIFEGLFVLLGLALVAAVIKYPKDALVKLPLGIFYHLVARPIKLILSIPLWIIGLPLIFLGKTFNWKITPTIERLLDFGANEDDDRPYSSTKNIRINFKEGEKYIIVILANNNVKKIIAAFLEVLTEKHSINDFQIGENGDQKIVGFPKDINFYDFHLLVQHFNDEFGYGKSFGFYKSDKTQYYVYQDTKTTNNLVGFTSEKEYFSIYMLDDLDKKQYLKINQKLKLDTVWVERWNCTTAITPNRVSNL